MCDGFRKQRVLEKGECHYIYLTFLYSNPWIYPNPWAREHLLITNIELSYEKGKNQNNKLLPRCEDSSVVLIHTVEESELDTESLSSAAEELCDLEETSSHSGPPLPQSRDEEPVLLPPSALMLQHYTEWLVAVTRCTRSNRDCHFAVVPVGK